MEASSSTATPLTPLQEECVSLLKAKQYASCEIVAHMDLATAVNQASTAVPLELLGDCAQATQQYRRAVAYYRRAALVNNQDAKLRWKEAQCLQSLGNVIEAASILERCSERTLGMSMTLGHLYVATGRNVDAIQAFLEALRTNAHALEAVEWLAKLGAERDDILDAVEQGMPSLHLLPIVKIVSAHYLMHRNQNTQALDAFSTLERHFPDNVCLLRKIATLQLQSNDDASAEKTFMRVRHLDENNVETMDQYAQLFQRRGAVDELNRLAMEMLEINDKRPEAWVILALYHETRSDHEKALAFADKAISMDQRHALAHRVKGNVLLAQDAPEKAAASFFHANEICRDVASYEGLVECYLARHQYKEAICMAREAIEVAPRDPRAVTLVGLALSQARPSEGRERAKRAFRKALTLDAGALRPLLALVDIYMQEKDYTTCIHLLQKGMEGMTESHAIHTNQDMLQTKLGEVYTLNENYIEAISCFHTAIALNPDNTSAQQGLDQLEKVMKGIDNDEEISALDNSGDGMDSISSPDYNYGRVRRSSQQATQRGGGGRY